MEKVFSKDKVYHILVCMVVALYSTECAMCCALTKEWCDWKVYYNHWCWWDVLADTIGIAIGTTIRVLVIGRWNWV